MTRYLKKEKDLVPWRSAVDKIDYIEKMLVNSNQYSTLRKVSLFITLYRLICHRLRSALSYKLCWANLLANLGPLS